MADLKEKRIDYMCVCVCVCVLYLTGAKTSSTVSLRLILEISLCFCACVSCNRFYQSMADSLRYGNTKRLHICLDARKFFFNGSSCLNIIIVRKLLVKVTNIKLIIDVSNCLGANKKS